MLRSDVAEIVARRLRAEPLGVAAAYLFGSHARGEARTTSDVDLGVLFAHAPPPTLDGQPFALAARLSEDLGCEVDLVVLNTAPVDLAKRVLRDGVLVFEADPSRRVRFEVDTRNRFFDLLPILQRYRGMEAG